MQEFRFNCFSKTPTSYVLLEIEEENEMRNFSVQCKVQQQNKYE